ncbi:MAG: hypothetical protein QF704_15785 [Anaerolineales bacterium]|jgi:hypothetical protein|nr:hypothetical protein [Anaerolineales bacterium]
MADLESICGRECPIDNKTVEVWNECQSCDQHKENTVTRKWECTSGA